MSVAKVLKLAEHRDRRRHRVALTRAMFGRDRARKTLTGHLAEVAELTGSDRVAAVWIDEYGPGVVHPYVVLDLLSDRPRRLFSIEPLQKAWDFGIPGILDELRTASDERAATFSVALGSDGARGWFVVADSVTRQLHVDDDRRGRLMFLAGEISSVVLHADLDRTDEEEDRPFAGWAFLKDLEGHESDDERSGIVGRRFEVGRLMAGLVGEDLCVPTERREELAARAWESVSSDADVEADELALLGDMLEAYEDGELSRIETVTLEAGQAAERIDHVAGSLELYRCAYEIAAALGDAETAIEAARSSGRVLRRRSEWKKADGWYQTALDIAQRAQIWDLIARTRIGLAVTRKDRGDLTGAREGLQEALEAANVANDADTTASVYHDLMTLEYTAGELPLAARHGWRAVNTYASDEGRSRCLVAFAWILKELGDLEAAEDAYAVACETVSEFYYSIYAHDGFAHMAALRGDVAAFDQRAAKCDALGWEDGPATAKAQILYFRGLSHRLLGRADEARSWLERAADFAEANSLEIVLDDARNALRELSGTDREQKRPDATPAPPEIRAGLRAMRDEVVGPLSA